MTGRALFFQRLFHYWRYQWKVFQTVIDWTVALYIVLPAAAFAVYQYADWLNGRGLLNGAAGVLGWGWLYVFSALLLCTGFIHTFLLEADHVFLVHAKHLMQKLKRYALLYSMFLSLIKWGALAVLLFPLWRQYGDCTLPAYSGMFCCLFGFHTAILAVHRHRKNSRRTFGNQAAGWLKLMVLMAGAFFMIVFAAEWYWLWPAGCILFICSALLTWKGTETLSAFEEEVLEENRRKLSFAASVLMLSHDVQLPNGKNKGRSKPFLYPGSKHIFTKRSAYTAWKELFFKVLIRNGGYLRQLYLLTAAFTALILVLPLLVKPAVLILFAIVSRYAASLLFDRITDKPVLSGIKRDSDDYFRARNSALTVIQIICSAWCLIAAILAVLYM
ncbi:ABC transporter permease [Bacillus velezensis]|uniref:ABC transporter permease n=1 Tax=Bacillus velezensis TaxID=492670 RepID=UPI000D727D60|nr:ABC transporter permease [Bacillus velezensis]AWQ14390.1 ABC transporter permease [Bacillus velezensis]